MRTWLHHLRAFFRLTRVGLHLCWGTATVAIVFPCIPLHWRRALKRRWSRQLLDILGVKLGVRGAAPVETPQPALLVCNHISWLDVFVINALIPAVSVAKAEVRAWPLIGWLCARTETIFLARGSRSAARHALAAMVEKLLSGAPVAFFPEGTTSDGARVLPFHAALFQAAIEAKQPVQPLALSYVDRCGLRSRAAAYDGEITLWQSLCALARAPGLVAELHVLPTLDPGHGRRGALARHSRAAIERALGQRAMPAHGLDAADEKNPDFVADLVTQPVTEAVLQRLRRVPEAMRVTRRCRTAQAVVSTISRSGGNCAEKVLPLPGTDSMRRRAP